MRLLRPNLNNRPTPSFWPGYLLLTALLILAGITLSQIVTVATDLLK